MAQGASAGRRPRLEAGAFRKTRRCRAARHSLRKLAARRPFPPGRFVLGRGLTRLSPVLVDQNRAFFTGANARHRARPIPTSSIYYPSRRQLAASALALAASQSARHVATVWGCPTL